MLEIINVLYKLCFTCGKCLHSGTVIGRRRPQYRSGHRSSGRGYSRKLAACWRRAYSESSPSTRSQSTGSLGVAIQHQLGLKAIYRVLVSARITICY